MRRSSKLIGWPVGAGVGASAWAFFSASVSSARTRATPAERTDHPDWRLAQAAGASTMPRAATT
jgi:hypothetical protein